MASVTSLPQEGTHNLEKGSYRATLLRPPSATSSSLPLALRTVPLLRLLCRLCRVFLRNTHYCMLATPSYTVNRQFPWTILFNGQDEKEHGDYPAGNWLVTYRPHTEYR